MQSPGRAARVLGGLIVIFFWVSTSFGAAVCEIQKPFAVNSPDQRIDESGLQFVAHELVPCESQQTLLLDGHRQAVRDPKALQVLTRTPRLYLDVENGYEVQFFRKPGLSELDCESSSQCSPVIVAGPQLGLEFRSATIVKTADALEKASENPRLWYQVHVQSEDYWVPADRVRYDDQLLRQPPVRRQQNLSETPQMPQMVDASGRPLSGEQIAKVEAVARTIYDDARNCFYLGSRYPRALARLTLNKGVKTPAKGKEKNEMNSPTNLNSAQKKAWTQSMAIAVEAVNHQSDPQFTADLDRLPLEKNPRCVHRTGAEAGQDINWNEGR